MKKQKIKKVKRHLKLKPFLIFVFMIFLIFGIGFYLYDLSIKNIYIVGNDFLKDSQIIEAAGIKEYPKMFKYSSSTLQKKIASLDLVDSVKVKKSLFGQLSIEIKEAKVLFYNRNTFSYVLSNGKETSSDKFTGVPFLINYVPNTIYTRLVKELSHIRMESMALISEIEYSPSKSGDIVLDDTRFLLRMNDGNQVYINLINIDRLDMYALIYTGLTEKGILELDSDNENVYFHS